MQKSLALERRLLGVVRQVNLLLVAEEPEQEMFPKICRAIVQEAGVDFAWIGYRDRNDRCRVVVVGQAGQMAQHPGHLRPAEGGAAERALISGKTAIDSGHDPSASAELALPLSVEDGVSGVLVIGFPHDFGMTPDAISLIEGLTALMARSVCDRRSEVELRHAQHISGVFLRKFETSMLAVVQAIATALEKRDPYTAGHQRRVAALAMAIGKEIGLSNHRLQGLHLGSLIHDIGKIQVPAEILARPGLLRREEMDLIRIHPTAGLEIVQDIDFPWPIGLMIVQHHERLDGSGYPKGIAGDDIILESRIIAVADVVEAMAAHRPYRPALGIEPALDEIRRRRGQYYDPAVVDICGELFARQPAAALFGEESGPSPSIADVAASPPGRSPPG